MFIVLSIWIMSLSYMITILLNHIRLDYPSILPQYLQISQDCVTLLLSNVVIILSKITMCWSIFQQYCSPYWLSIFEDESGQQRLQIQIFVDTASTYFFCVNVSVYLNATFGGEASVYLRVWGSLVIHLAAKQP